MDPENPVVKLCVAGMHAEGRGDVADARRMFGEAWTIAGNDFEACIAAHYVARHQSTAEDMLWWNQEAFRLAEAVGDERVADFFPSLLLNLGHSHEAVGHVEKRSGTTIWRQQGLGTYQTIGMAESFVMGQRQESNES